MGYHGKIKKGGAGMKTPQEAGAILRKLRGDRTIKQVSEDLGISWQALQSYEAGTRTPRDSKKENIAKYYGLTISEIFF